MAHFTKNMKQRLFAQGWKFSNDYYSIFEDDVYSNDKYPGVYIKETACGNFEIYSDFIYKTEKEKIQEAYKKGYSQGYNSGINRGYYICSKNGYNKYKEGYEKGYDAGYEQCYLNYANKHLTY